MVKKNRPALIFAAFLFIGICEAKAADVKLELSNVDLVKRADGKSIPTVGINQSFNVDIIIKDGGRSPGNIALQGLDAVQVIQQGQSSSTQIVNGTSISETTYHITVQARREGPLTLGPAQIKLDDKTVSSNAVFVDVRKDHAQSTNQQDALRAGQPSVLCKLSADKQTVVVGEPITLTLSVYSQGPILEMGLESVSFDRFLVKESKNKIERSEVVDGISYKVQEIKYMLTPLEEGIKEIKPVSVQYLVQSQQNRSARHGHFNFGGAIEAFFGQQSEQKRVTSNDLKITVLPLPEHKEQVHGIGSFSSFTASLNKQNADLNEPLTLTLSIEGQGNFEQIAIPKIALPKWFKSYESKTDSQDTFDGGKKQFNFIVQASKSGKLQIPSQSFTYFDVTTRSFKTLKTASINLEINTPDDYQSTPVPTQTLQKENSVTEHVSKEEIQGQETSMLKASSLTAVRNIALPWWLFIMLLLVPLLLFKKKLLSIASQVITKLFGTRIHRHNLALFDKQLQAMQAKGDANGLHQLFLKFLAAKNNIIVDLVTEDWIEQRLKQLGWIPEKVDEFLEFLSTCARLRFMKSQTSSIDQNALLKKSKYWLIMLNK